MKGMHIHDVFTSVNPYVLNSSEVTYMSWRHQELINEFYIHCTNTISVPDLLMLGKVE